MEALTPRPPKYVVKYVWHKNYFAYNPTTPQKVNVNNISAINDHKIKLL